MELLSRFAAGDLEAFETLYRQLHRDVYGWIIRIVRDPGIAEDLTVETFWRMYRARARFDPTRSIDAWARRIATNVALDHLRKQRPQEQLPEQVAGAPVADPCLESEVRDRIQRAFTRLPPKLKAAAVLALVEERPYEEIASALGTTVGAVKLRVFRAVRLLRKRLGNLVETYDGPRSGNNPATSKAGAAARRS